VRNAVANCKGGGYYPGWPRDNPGGRPAEISEHQEFEIARAAMELKNRKLNSRPAWVRAKLPRLLMNPGTGKPISDGRTRSIFKARCYDDSGDDPW
jgi:hypothetical protein